MLSLRLFLQGSEVIAALNLYSTQRAAFEDYDETLGAVLATHGAVAIAGAEACERVGNLEAALRTNRDIGAAVGILMNSRKVTRDQAFDSLRVVSQMTNRKIIEVALEVALEVVETGSVELPERFRGRVDTGQRHAGPAD